MARADSCSPEGKFLIVMIDINYTTRVFPYPQYGSVCVRVRWNKKKNSVEFTTGDFVELDKWDSNAQRAKANTKHVVRGHEKSAREINKQIGIVLDHVESVFRRFEKINTVPDNGAFRAALRELLEEEELTTKPPRKSIHFDSMTTICQKFVASRKAEVSLETTSMYKYPAIIKHLLDANPGIRIDLIDKNALIRLRDHCFKKGYHNYTIVRWFKSLKAILRWAKNNGYEVKDEALNYKHHISVPKKRVVHLTYDELLAFYRFEFPEGTAPHILRARDFFCFMSFTSLRYSDLFALKKGAVSTRGALELYSKKTSAMLTIPLISFAQDILNRYTDTPGDALLPVPSPQKLNDYIKEAAKLAGLDRTIVETYFVDKDKHEDSHKLYETLSCHDARRTFACCSIRLGISPTTVMKCMGQTTYENMKPYIEIADDAVAKEMRLWETEGTKREIIKLLDDASPETLNDILNKLKGK